MSTVSSPGNSEIEPRKQGPDREIYRTQGLNPSILPCRQILYHLSYQGSPRILEWVAYPFSKGTSQPRNSTGGFYTSWGTRCSLSFLLGSFEGNLKLLGSASLPTVGRYQISCISQWLNQNPVFDHLGCGTRIRAIVTTCFIWGWLVLTGFGKKKLQFGQVSN